MRWLKVLLLRLGRWLERLGRLLVAWAKHFPEREPEVPWAEDPPEGPPEHWLRYLRQRSPWLVRGSNAPRALRYVAGAMRSGGHPEEHASAHKNDSLNPQATREDERARRRESEKAREREGERTRGREGERARGLPLGPVQPATDPGSASGREAAPMPRGLQRIAKAAAVVRPTQSAAQPVAEPASSTTRWVRFKGLRSEAATEAAGREPVQTEHVTAAEPTGWPSEPPLPASFNRATPRAHPESAAEQVLPQPVAARGTVSGIGSAREDEQRSADESQWPELPDIPWSEDAWSVPSRQALMKEQLRLTRLRAEQAGAGSSWSGPLS